MSVNFDDLDQFNEVEEIDENASSYDELPPPPPGIHPVKLKLVEGAWKGKDKALNREDGTIGIYESPKGSGKRHPMVTVEIVVENPGKPGHGQRATDWPGTAVDPNRRTSKVDTYLRVLTGQAGVGLTPKQKIEKLIQLLQTEPLVRAETDWKGEFVEKDENGEYRKGSPVKDGKPLSSYKNFPDNASGDGKVMVSEDDNGLAVRTVMNVKMLLSA